MFWLVRKTWNWGTLVPHLLLLFLLSCCLQQREQLSISHLPTRQYPPPPPPNRLLIGHPPAEETSADQLSCQRPVSRSAYQSVDLSARKSSLFAFPLIGQPVSQSNRQLVIHAGLSVRQRTVSCAIGSFPLKIIKACCGFNKTFKSLTLSSQILLLVIS